MISVVKILVALRRVFARVGVPTTVLTLTRLQPLAVLVGLYEIDVVQLVWYLALCMSFRDILRFVNRIRLISAFAHQWPTVELFVPVADEVGCWRHLLISFVDTGPVYACPRIACLQQIVVPFGTSITIETNNNIFVDIFLWCSLCCCLLHIVSWISSDGSPSNLAQRLFLRDNRVSFTVYALTGCDLLNIYTFNL